LTAYIISVTKKENKLTCTTETTTKIDNEYKKFCDSSGHKQI